MSKSEPVTMDYFNNQWGQQKEVQRLKEAPETEID